MYKKLFFSSILLISIIGAYYPSKNENTKFFDYCYSLEKIIFRNSIQRRKNIPTKLKSISMEISKFGVNKTRGLFISKMINQYKYSKNSFIINVIPNKFYCYSGYWVETLIPGTFESIIYNESKKSINEFKEFKDEIEGLINNLNFDHKNKVRIVIYFER